MEGSNEHGLERHHSRLAVSPRRLGGDLLSNACTVEVQFVARYKVGGGSAVKMAEHSRFRRIDGRWYYLDAVG